MAAEVTSISFNQLADECEERMWRPDDRLPTPGDCYSGHTPPPRVAPSVHSQLDQVLKVLAVLLRERSSGIK